MPLVARHHTHHVVDFDRLDDEDPQRFACDTLTCCLGTTIAVAGSREAFRRVDHHLPLAVARLALAQGATQLQIVTALGANAASRIFYNRVKGDVEADLRALGAPSLQILRPSLLTGERREARLGERVGEVALGLLRPLLLGPLRSLRPTAASDVARALVALAAARPPGVTVAEPESIRTWGGGAAA
jgi:uncharacterized protein YbjT (DUF2867 family)